MINKRTIKKFFPAGAVQVTGKEWWNYFTLPGMTQDELCEWRNKGQKEGWLCSATLHQTMGPNWRPIIMIYNRPFAYMKG